MRLTLTREQIPLAQKTVKALRHPGPGAVDVPDLPRGAVTLPGHSKWWGDAMSKTVDHAYADALEAAITEAEGKDADPRQPGPVSDADEAQDQARCGARGDTMKLTLTREQIPLARETVAWMRDESGAPKVGCYRDLPGYLQWLDDNRAGAEDDAWADALEAAITEAEGTQAPQPGPVSDADERAFWREAYLTGRAHAVTSMASTYQAAAAADEADMALDRYRKAFCTGMPSDQKGAK